jgi:hypothetical protein
MTGKDAMKAFKSAGALSKSFKPPGRQQKAQGRQDTLTQYSRSRSRFGLAELILLRATMGEPTILTSNSR